MRVLFALFALVASVATVSAQGWTGPNFWIVDGDGTDFIFSINGTQQRDPALTFTVGTTYKFIINKTMNIHPFGFSVDNAAVANPPMSNLTGATEGGVTLSGSCVVGSNSNNAWTTSDTANPCIVSITPPADAPAKGAIYYRCSIHGGMIGTLTAVAAGGATTATPTTSAPTGNGTTTTPTTTATPTTPAPAGSSTGKSGAAVIVPGAAAFIIAAINALFSA